MPAAFGRVQFDSIAFQNTTLGFYNSRGKVEVNFVKSVITWQ